MRIAIAIIPVIILLSAVAGCTAVPADTGVTVPGNGYFSRIPAYGSIVTMAEAEDFTDGEVALRINAAYLVAGESTKITIKSIDPVYDTEGVTELGVWVAGPSRDIASLGVAYTGWRGEAPPSDRRLGVLRSPTGITIKTQEASPAGWELLVGFRPAGDGIFHRTGLWITYEWGGVEYRDFLRAEVLLCVGKQAIESDSCA